MDWVLLCHNCGLPLNDAVMAGNGNYLCCSGSKNTTLCTSSRMICPLNEIPLIHVEDIKKHFDSVGYNRKNISNQDEITATVSEQAEYGGMYFNQFEGKRTSCFKEQLVVKEVEFRCSAVSAIGNRHLKEGATGQTITFGKFKESEEHEVGPVHEDFSGAQSPCSSNNSEQRELAVQGNVNSIPLSDRVANILVGILVQYATDHEAFKPEEVSTLQSAFGRLMSVSSGEPDHNRNGIGGKFGYSASDVTHNKTVESRLADVETKLAHLEELLRFRQISAEQIEAEHRMNCNTLQVLKDDAAKLQSDVGEMKSLFQRQFTEFIDALNMQTPYHVHDQLSTFIRNAKVNMEERIQTLERSSQSLQVMLDKLTRTITKLHLVCEVCGAPNVQGTP